jgi:hypothetical protein
VSSKILHAELIISAQNRAADALGKLQQDIARAQKSVERFRAAMTKFSESRSSFRNAQEAMERAAAAMRGAATPTAAMTRAYEKAQRAVSRASSAFNAQKEAVLGAKRELESLGVSVSRLASEENRLKVAAIEADAAMARQQRRAALAASLGRGFSNVSMFLGPGLLAADRSAIRAGAAYQHEVAFAYPAAGIGADETAWARNSASALASKYPIVSSGDILKLYRETRSVISGEVKGREGLTQAQRLAIAASDTQRVFPSVIRADAALKASGAEAGDLQRLVKGLEALGITQDPDRTEKILDAYVRATQVAGGTIPIDNVLRAIQQMLGVGGMLSDRFIKSTFLSLVQEGGSRVGAGIGAMDLQFLGEMGNKQAAEWLRLGFLHRDDLIFTETGAIKGLKPGHNIAGYQQALSDPDLFLWQRVLPALIAAGYTTTTQQIQEVQQLFGAQRARRIAAAIVQQQPTYEQASAKFDAALGNSAADIASRSAPAALRELGGALSTFAAALTSPMMDHAALVLDKLAQGLASAANYWSGFAKSNPHMAEIVGAVGVGGAGVLGAKWSLGLVGKLFGGPALNRSAAALMGSAEALNAAAARLGGSGTPGGPAADVPTSRGSWLRSFASSLPGGPLALQLYDLQEQAAAKAKDMPVVPWSWSGYLNSLSGGLLGSPFKMPAPEPELKGNANLNVHVTIDHDGEAHAETSFSGGIPGVNVKGTTGDLGRAWPDVGR